MFGMSHDAYLLLDALVTIIGLIVLITRSPRCIPSSP